MKVSVLPLEVSGRNRLQKQVHFLGILFIVLQTCMSRWFNKNHQKITHQIALGKNALLSTVQYTMELEEYGLGWGWDECRLGNVPEPILLGWLQMCN